MGYGRARVMYSTTFLLFSALLLGSLVLTSKPARAACIETPNYEVDLRDSADLIVSGTAGKVEVSSATTRAEVRVDRVFKGASGELLTVTTLGSRSGEYAVPFTTGGRYLLYLKREGDSYEKTSICSGSQPVGSSLPPEIAETLGEGTSPSTTKTIPKTGGPKVLTLAALPGLCLLSAWAVVRWRVR